MEMQSSHPPQPSPRRTHSLYGNTIPIDHNSLPKEKTERTTMPPAAPDKMPTSPKAMTTTPQPTDGQYYKAGSSEIVTETKLTVSRLETRRRLTKTSDRLVIVLVGLPVCVD
jgi:hypothetical protein